MDNQCCKSVWHEYNNYPCSRKGTYYLKNKPYCYQHFPPHVKARQEESSRKYQEEMDKRLAPAKWILKAKEVLKKHQYTHIDSYGNFICIECRSRQSIKCAPDCALAELLKENPVNEKKPDNPNG